MIRIGIIEDNEYMRQGWQTILDFEQDMCVMATFDRCETALNSDELVNIDVLLLDIELPGIDGTEGITQIKKIYPDLLVLMVTMYDENEKVFQALRNGATGYLLKKTSPSELIEAVRTAVGGGSPMSPKIARMVIDSFHIPSENRVELSEIEASILKHLSNGLSYKAIADTVYLSVDGVRYHIRHIYEKLEARNRSEAVAKGLNLNLIRP